MAASILDVQAQSEQDRAFYFLAKSAGDLSKSVGFHGRLVVTEENWGMLEVPNAVVRGLFDSIHEPGIQLPVNSQKRLKAHVTVFRPEEIEQLGGAEAITERGQFVPYQLGSLSTCCPDGWKDISKCWVVQVESPAMKKIRRSYGLDELPKYPLHLTVAVRRKSVLQSNETSKTEVPQKSAATFAKVDSPPPSTVRLGSWSKDEICPHCGKASTYYQDKKGWSFCRGCFRKGKGRVERAKEAAGLLRKALPFAAGGAVLGAGALALPSLIKALRGNREQPLMDSVPRPDPRTGLPRPLSPENQFRLFGTHQWTPHPGYQVTAPQAPRLALALRNPFTREEAEKLISANPSILG